MEFRFKTKPYKHQLDALKTSCEKDEYALLMDMGTGKSKVLIDTIAYLYDAGKINGAVIVAPKGVYKTWYDNEIPTHLVDHVKYKAVLWQSNVNKKQEKEQRLKGKKLSEMYSTSKLAATIRVTIKNVNNYFLTGV